jgi:hypothetical protein
MDSHAAADLARLEERLRQQQETFDQKKTQDQMFFYLRMVIGVVAIVLFVAICAFCGYVLLNSRDFPAATTTAATTTLLVEALGIVGGIWKVIFGEGPKELEPVTPPR